MAWMKMKLAHYGLESGRRRAVINPYRGMEQRKHVDTQPAEMGAETTSHKDNDKGAM